MKKKTTNWQKGKGALLGDEQSGSFRKVSTAYHPGSGSIQKFIPMNRAS
ncbi:MAG: hypothetical protein R2825_02835 [Saprospiraceae bacterium]